MRLSKLLAAEIENPNKKRGYVFGVNLNCDGDIILNCADENEEIGRASCRERVCLYV